jgi:hypothetical protein
MLKEDKMILAGIVLVVLLAFLLDGCFVKHTADGKIETSGDVNVTINYKNCDHPEWSSEEVIACIKEASSVELSTDEATEIFDLLKQQEG